MRKSLAFSLLLAFGSVGAATNAAAQSAEDDALTASIRAAANSAISPELRNTRTMGMGEAFAGGGSGTGAIYHNPAGVLAVPIYESQLGYQRGFAGDSNAIGVSLADAKTNPTVAAGIAYSFGFARDEALQDFFDEHDELSKTDNRVRDHDIRGAIAFPLVPQVLSLGAGLRYVNHQRGSWTQTITVTDEVDGDGDPNTTDDRITTTSTEDRRYDISVGGVTLDAGMMAQVSENIGLGFAVHNILEIEGLDEGRSLEGGLGGYFGAAHVEVAYISEQVDGKFQHGVALGLEYVVDAAPIRAGFRYEGDELSYLSVGFGYRNERVGGDFAYEQNVNLASDRTLGASLALYF